MSLAQNPELIIGGAMVTLLGAWGYAIKKMADKGVVCKCKVGICPNSCCECACDSNDKNDEDFFQDTRQSDAGDEEQPPTSAKV